MDHYQSTETVKKILRTYRTVAVVGLSDKPERASHTVASYMQSQGYRIVPVNPRISRVLGEDAYPDLVSIPFEIEIVDIFRRSEDVPPIVDAAIEKGVRAVWMQQGVINETAAEKATAAGLEVVMDLCMLQEHEKHGF
jgi:predicted CoA-binding protein